MLFFFYFEQMWENAQVTVQTFPLVNYNLRLKRNSSSRLLQYCKSWSLSKTTNHIAIVTNIEYKSGFCTKIECWAEETRVRFGVLNYTKGCRSAAARCKISSLYVTNKYGDFKRLQEFSFVSHLYLSIKTKSVFFHTCTWCSLNIYIFF